MIRSVAESSPPVAEHAECVQGAGGHAGAGEQAQVDGGSDQSGHAGLVRKADEVIGVVLDELVECADFRLGQSGLVLDQHSAVQEGVRGGANRRRASADIQTVGGDGLLHAAAGHGRAGDLAVRVLLQPASRFARHVFQRAASSGRPATVSREGEFGRTGRRGAARGPPLTGSGTRRQASLARTRRLGMRHAVAIDWPLRVLERFGDGLARPRGLPARRAVKAKPGVADRPETCVFCLSLP